MTFLLEVTDEDCKEKDRDKGDRAGELEVTALQVYMQSRITLASVG